MELRAKVYIKNKFLKYSNAISQKGEFIHLFVLPKNLQQNLDEAEQAVAEQKSKKKKILNLMFFLLNIVIIVGILTYQILHSEDMSISTLLESTFSPSIFLIVFLVFALFMAVETFRMNVLIIHSSGRSRPFLSYKVFALGRYYDSITPMATGGQPFQIFYLSNRGLNAAASISVPMGRYVATQVSTIIIWTIALIVAFCVDLGDNFSFIRPLCIIGWILNSALMFAVAFLSVNERVGRKIVAWVLRALQKIKVVKNYEKQYNRVIKTVNDFQVTIKNFARQKKTFFLILISSFLCSLITYTFPFLIYSMMIGYFDFSMWPYFFVLGILIDMASSFIPLPGGSGVSELSFSALFASVFSNSATLTWALIFWRLMTYYIYLIQGLLVLMYDKFIGNKKYVWQKRKWELEEESINFTQDKLQEYNQSKLGHHNKIV